MLIRVRTTDGYVDMTEQEVRQRLAARYGQEGPAVIEHNAFMNRHYPLTLSSVRATFFNLDYKLYAIPNMSPQQVSEHFERNPQSTLQARYKEQ